MPNLILQQIYTNLFHTLAALVLLFVSYFLLVLFLRKKHENNKNRRRFRTRVFYVFSFIFIIILARIWIMGFTHLLAVLGLVSAALVVTNKETVMNLTGWLIILWRDLFTEDDYIEIQQHKGYVRKIGLLYFTLSEMSSVTDNHVSGRMVKIPNGLVINNVVTNHSHKSYLFKVHMTAIFAPQSDVTQAKKIVISTVASVLDHYCKDHPEYTEEYILRKHRGLKDLTYLKPSVLLKAKFDKPSGIQIQVSYFCYAKDQELLEKLIWEKLFQKLKNNPKLKLSFDGHTT